MMAHSQPYWQAQGIGGLGVVFQDSSDHLEYMGVSKNRGILPPKWMVKIMENPIKIHDFAFFLETPIYCIFKVWGIPT